MRTDADGPYQGGEREVRAGEEDVGGGQHVEGAFGRERRGDGAAASSARRWWSWKGEGRGTYSEDRGGRGKGPSHGEIGAKEREHEDHARCFAKS